MEPEPNEYIQPTPPTYLISDRRRLHNSITWSKVLGSLALLLATIPIGVMVYIIREGRIPLASDWFYLTALCLGTLELLLIMYAVHAWSISRLWERELRQNQLRFDVRHGVEIGLRHSFGRYLPGIRRQVSDLNLGEELLREAKRVSERELYYALAIQELVGNHKTAMALKELTALASRNSGIDTDRLRRIIDQYSTPPTVVPFRSERASSEQP